MPDTPPSGERQTHGVESARRVLRLLLCFSEATPLLTVDQLSDKLGVSTPSLYRFLSLLRELDLVESVQNGTYSLSPRLFSLARAAEAGTEFGGMIPEMLRRLNENTGEAALLIRRVGNFATCSEVHHPQSSIRLSFEPGQILSLHRGAGAKLLLAQFSTAALDQYCDQFVTSSTAETELRKNLESIREAGWAESKAEVDEGIYAVAAPIYGGGNRVTAAVSVAGPEFRIPRQLKNTIKDTILKEAAELSTHLSYTQTS